MVTTISLILGGLGLLLLGMAMMTDGLRLAAGQSLHRWLRNSTETRIRAAGSGFLLTALVQSSGAVTVATLGFTNAGILGLRQAAWVIFGSNVGTTMTAWIVALIGLNLKVDLLALPMVGIGIILRLVSSRQLSHIGTTIAGFGLLFLGLSFLKDSFSDAAALFPTEQLATGGVWNLTLAVVAGALLTTLMQSSSASLAIVLTAAAQGVVVPVMGAAMVIGANVGSTSTALLAAIGATAAAKRLTVIHLAFNVLTAAIALLLLSPLWWITSVLAETTQQNTLAAQLAVFHTLFNLLGLALMWPLADRLVAWVEGLFRQREVQTSKLQYLDETVMAVPEMGLAALNSELQRVFLKLIAQARVRLRGTQAVGGDHQERHGEEGSVSELLGLIADYSSRLGQQPLSHTGVSERLLDLLQAQYECEKLQDSLRELAQDLTEEHRRAQPWRQLSEALEALFARIEKEPAEAGQLADSVRQVSDMQQLLRSHVLEDLKASGNAPAEAARLLSFYAAWERAAHQVVAIAGLLWKEPAGESGSQAKELPVEEDERASVGY